MNIYREIRKRVSPKEAALFYGMKVSRSGFARCPFHPDRHPSLKLYQERYFCFGCHAWGDATDLTAKLLGITNREAAYRIVKDFGIKLPVNNRRKEKEYLSLLKDYLWMLKKHKKDFAPPGPGVEMDERFVRACRQEGFIMDLCRLLAWGSPEEKAHVLGWCRKNGRRLKEGQEAKRKARGMCLKMKTADFSDVCYNKTSRSRANPAGRPFSRKEGKK